MLTRYFQKVWLVQELRSGRVPDHEIASKIRVTPFFLREYVDAARSYSRSAIEGCLSALLTADETLKSTSVDPKVVMTLLLHHCMAGRRQEEPA